MCKNIPKFIKLQFQAMHIIVRHDCKHSIGCVRPMFFPPFFWPLHALIIALKMMTKLLLVVATIFNFLNAFKPIHRCPNPTRWTNGTKRTRLCWLYGQSVSGQERERTCDVHALGEATQIFKATQQQKREKM